MTNPSASGKRSNALHTLLGWLKGYVLIAPAIILLCIFTIYPIFWQVQSSLYDGSLLSKKRNFVGLKNFANLLSNPDFGQTVGNTIFYSVGVVIITIILSTLAAVWLNGKAQKRLNSLR